MSAVNPELYSELQSSYSQVRVILQSFPPELNGLENPSMLVKYDEKVTDTYRLVEDLQKKVGKILDDIQRGYYD